MAERICVAQIGGAHGLRGEVKLKSFTADPMAVKNYGPLTAEDGSACFEIETLRPAKGHLVARFRGIGVRIEDDVLVTPATCRCSRLDASTLIFGAGDILELQPKAGGTSIMVPFTAAFVPSVDIAGGRIVVAPLEDAPGNRGAATKSEY